MPLFAKGKMEYRDDDIPVTRLHLYLFGLLQLKKKRAALPFQSPPTATILIPNILLNVQNR